MKKLYLSKRHRAYRLYFCFLTICISTNLAPLSAQTKVDSLEKRINVLEDYKSNIEQLYAINTKQLEGHVDEQINAKVKDVDEQKKTLNLLLLIGIPGTLVGLLLAYWGAIAKAKKLIINKIETIVEHKREELIKLIETQEYDSRLKTTKKILVLSTNEVCQESAKKLFQMFGFKNVRFRIVQDFQNFSDYDLIMFNDFDKTFTQELIDQYIQQSTDQEIGFVAYTTNNLRRDPKLNFSNSQFTLYHNLLSTLKYNQILKLTATEAFTYDNE